MVKSIHPFTKWKQDRRRLDRKPSASQDAVRHWWTVNGTKAAQKELEALITADNVGVIEGHLSSLAEQWKRNTLSAPFTRVAADAAEWGKYERMLELHRGL